MKSFLRELPPGVKKILGEGYFLFPVDGDGACGPRTFASWIFQDPTLGPYLARNINQHFVNYWDGYWKNFFSLPFVRLVGNGKEIKKETEEDLLEFLTNSQEGEYMWRGDDDFSVISNCSMKIQSSAELSPILISRTVVSCLQEKFPR